MMVNMSGVQLRRELRIQFINEAGYDAGGLITDFVKELSLIFGSADHLFENFGDSGVCITGEVALTANHLEPIFQFFGRFLAFSWYHTKTLNFFLSKPLIKLIKGEKVSMVDIKNSDPSEFKKYQSYLSISEEDWDMQSDVWTKMIPKGERERRQKSFYVPLGRGM